MPDHITPTNFSTPSEAPLDVHREKVREYVGSLAAELSKMAFEEGDIALANALDKAVDIAARPIEIASTLRRSA